MREVDQQADAPPPDADSRLRPGGEFRAAALESAYLWERIGETLRHARLLLIGSIVLNTLFFASDWRFHGTPHFWVAIPARAIVVAASIVALALVRRCASPRALDRLLIAWMAVVALAIAALVSSRSDIALFVVLMLPMLYYLLVPVAYRWTLAGGIGCSAAMLAGYEWNGDGSTTLGIVLAVTILNVGMGMTVARQNRLQRQQWLAAGQQRRIADALAESRAMLSILFEASPVPLVVTAPETRRILQMNGSAVALLGGRREDIAERSFTSFYADRVTGRQLELELGRKGHIGGRELELRAAGGVRTVLLNAALVDVREGMVAIVGMTDISDRKAVERRLEALATTDPLTGLPNRLSFFARARAEQMRAARRGHPLSLLMIDIDHFKTVNDDWGHQAGDQALRRFATLCAERLRAHDIAGRLGGEEFGVLLPETDLANACAVAETLRGAMAALALPEAPGLRLTISVGVSPVFAHERDIDAAIGRADRALYAAKHRGRDRVAAHEDPRASGAG